MITKSKKLAYLGCPILNPNNNETLNPNKFRLKP